MSMRSVIFVVCGGLLAACSKGEPPRPAAKPVAAARPAIHPTVEPIRDDDGAGAPAAPAVAARADEPAARPARHAARPTAAAEDSEPAPAHATPVRTAHAAKHHASNDEPILSDQLFADVGDTPAPKPTTDDSDEVITPSFADAPAPKPAPKAAPKPAPTPAPAPEPTAAPTLTSVVSVGGVDAVIHTSLSAATVRKMLTKHLAGVKRCHLAYLRKVPDASGNVTAQINVGPNGNVSLARVMGFAPPLDACIKQALEHAHFATPTASGGVATTAPFKVHLWLGTKS